MSLGKDFERQVKRAANKGLKDASREAQRKLDHAYQRLKGKPTDAVRHGLKRDLKGTILEGNEDVFVGPISAGQRVELDSSKLRL